MWSFGNPLTYNDKRAASYGRARFAHMEGHFNNTKQRFAAFKDRNRSKTLDGVQIGPCAAFSLQHAIAMYARRCKRAAEAGLPLPEVGPVPGSAHWMEAQRSQGGEDPPQAPPPDKRHGQPPLTPPPPGMLSPATPAALGRSHAPPSD